MSSWSLDDLPAGRHGGDSPLTLIVQHFFRAPDGSAGFLDADVFAAVCSSWRAEPAARLAFQQQRRAAGVDFGNWGSLQHLLLRAHARAAWAVRLLRPGDHAAAAFTLHRLRACATTSTT